GVASGRGRDHGRAAVGFADERVGESVADDLPVGHPGVHRRRVGIEHHRVRTARRSAATVMCVGGGTATKTRRHEAGFVQAVLRGFVPSRQIPATRAGSIRRAAHAAAIIDTSMSRVIPLTPSQPRLAKPEWLKVRAPGSPGYLRLKGLMRELNLHTVCEEAQCPNIGECWSHGTATFMILGDVCTRACSYCAVAHGRPGAVDTAEPVRVADAIHTLGLDYVVITSVDRDDLPDRGASRFAAPLRET